MQAELIVGAARRMADDRLARFPTGCVELESHSHVLGAGATQTKLVRQVAAQPAGDEEERLAVFDRFFELPVGAGEQGWTPCVELIGFETARELHGVASVATQLALQLSRTDRRDRAQRAQAKQVEALEL